jgi:archaeal type IV pilus assembly protein PilA
MKQQKEIAVSPVVGVMLMLVVVIIIAAVVSGFAGGLVNSNSQQVPKLAMDANIVNTGYWASSYFKMQVTGVDKPIATKDLKIVTTWNKKFTNGTTIRGGATMLPNQLNFHVKYKVNGWTIVDNWTDVCPQGYGPGATGLNASAFPNFWPFELVGSQFSGASMNDVWSGKLGNNSWFGNYNLQAGTMMFARPFGGSLGGQSTGSSSIGVGYGLTDSSGGTTGLTGGGRYYYLYGTNSNAEFDPYPDSVDQMQAVLGNNWNNLRAGDIVTVKVIHTPSGRTIWQKDVSVEG